jgi:predicted nucleotidyltransferase
MVLAHYSEAKLRKQLKNLLSKYIDTNTHIPIFFGSRVNGKATDRSDIDLGILGNTPLDSKTLGLIKDGVENLPILYKIDVVDFATVSENFRQVALQKYEQV